MLYIYCVGLHVVVVGPNPMRLPMGMGTMGVTDMVFEGVLGNSVLFLGYAICWNENNMTTLLSGGGSFTYDEDGFRTSKTIGTGSQSTTYTFSYSPTDGGLKCHVRSRMSIADNK